MSLSTEKDFAQEVSNLNQYVFFPAYLMLISATWSHFCSSVDEALIVPKEMHDVGPVSFYTCLYFVFSCVLEAGMSINLHLAQELFSFLISVLKSNP